MAVDPATGGVTPDCEVMSSLDDGSLVIAELCRDDAWLAMPAVDAPSVADYR